MILSADNHLQIYIPEGFIHGFLVLEEGTIFVANVTNHRHLSDNIGVRWDDFYLEIEWPLDLLEGANLIMADKDRHYTKLFEIACGLHKQERL